MLPLYTETAKRSIHSRSLETVSHILKGRNKLLFSLAGFVCNDQIREYGQSNCGKIIHKTLWAPSLSKSTSRETQWAKTHFRHKTTKVTQEDIVEALFQVQDKLSSIYSICGLMSITFCPQFILFLKIKNVVATVHLQWESMRPCVWVNDVMPIFI